MNFLLSWFISALAIVVAAYVLPGVHVASFWTAIVLAVVLGILNLFIKPLLVILTLPITIITFGLFLIVINALLILLASVIVPGFEVDGFWWAVLFSLVLSAINLIAAKIK